MRARLDAVRRRAGLVLWVEALAAVAIGPVAVVLAYVMVLLAGGSGIGLRLGALLALTASVVWAGRQVARPTRAEMDRRIERDSWLAPWSLAMVDDRLVSADQAPPQPVAVRLFAAHRVRLAEQIGRARVGAPALDFFRRDRFGLRAIMLLGVVVLAVFAGPQAGPRLARGFALPDMIGPAPKLQIWLTPPSWTGQGPLVLESQRSRRVFAGTRLSLIVTGVARGDAGPVVRFGKAGQRLQAIGGGSFRAHWIVTQSGVLQVGPFWRRIARLNLQVIRPVAPRVALERVVMSRPSGRATIFWRIVSNYGVKRLVLALRPPLRVQLKRLPAERFGLRARQAGPGRWQVSLAASRYAGLVVSARLFVTSQRRETGISAPVPITLPAPVLHNPTARQIFLLRQHLALDPAGQAAVAVGLETLVGKDKKLGSGAITGRTERAMVAAAQEFARGKVAHPFELLWRLMLRAEQGNRFQAAQRLAQARAALEQALRRGIAQGAIDQKLVQKLLQNWQHAAASQQADAHTKPLTGAQRMAEARLDQKVARLTQRIADLAKAGAKAQARADLRKLERLLRGARRSVPRAQTQARQAAEAAAKAAAAQMAAKVTGMLRAQSALLDQSVAATRPLGSGAHRTSPRKLAQAQAGLQHQAQGMAQRRGAQSGGASPLGAAATAMGQAAAQLQSGNALGAEPAQRSAIAALQQAAQQAAAAERAGGSAPGSLGSGAKQAGAEGAIGGGGLRLNQAGAGNVARRIERRVIKRDAQPGLTARAHDYYRRLLQK